MAHALKCIIILDLGGFFWGGILSETSVYTVNNMTDQMTLRHTISFDCSFFLAAMQRMLSDSSTMSLLQFVNDVRRQNLVSETCRR